MPFFEGWFQTHDQMWVMIYEYDWYASKTIIINDDCTTIDGNFCQLELKAKYGVTEIYYDNSGDSRIPAECRPANKFDLTFNEFGFVGSTKTITTDNGEFTLESY